MMNKFITSIFAIFLLGLALVSAGDITVAPADQTETGLPGDSVGPVTYIVTNNGASDAILNIAAVELVGQADNTKKIDTSQVTVSPTSFTLAGSGEEQSVQLTVNIPKGLPTQFYTGTFSIKQSGVEEASFDLNVGIDPLDDLVLILTDPIVVTGQERDTRTTNFQIRNDGSNSLTVNEDSFSFLQSDFQDGDKNIVLTFTVDDESLAPGDTANVELKVDIPNNIEVNTYDGVITVDSGTDSETFNLEVRVHPELCENGPIGDLSVTIQEPDNNDDFAPGDTMRIEVEVENDGNKDLDVTVEAFLYNVDQDEEIEKVESDEDEVQEDDNLDFDLEFDIPFDEDLDEDDEYVLFVKAYEDEEDHCAEDQIDIDIEREKHDVRVKEVSLVPLSVKPGEFVDVTVRAVNVGSSNEDDVTVKVFEPELGWDRTSSPVDLEDGESSDNDATFRFTFQVPDNAEDKTYSIESIVTFDDGDEKNSEFTTFTVLEGDGGSPTPTPTDALTVQSITETGDNVFTASIVVGNDADKAKTFEIETLASWAQTVATQTVTVNAGDSRAIQLNVAANEGLQSGRYTGTISVREGGVLVDSETFTVDVEEGEAPGVTGFAVGDVLGGNSGTVIWILVDIVLVIVAIFFIRLIFTSGKKKRTPMAKTTEKVKL